MSKMIVYCVLCFVFLVGLGGGFLVDGDGNEVALETTLQSFQNQLQQANQLIANLQKQIGKLPSLST